jgi:hypothetical protein
LHARFPKLAIIVGLWGFAGGVLKAQERVGAGCTDAACTNFSETFFQIQRLIDSNDAETQGASENTSRNIAGPRAIAS